MSPASGRRPATSLFRSRRTTPSRATVIPIDRSWSAKGVEVESEWRQGPFSLLLGAIYTRAEIDRDAVDPTLKGSCPRHQANLLFNARPQVEFGSLTIGTQVNGTTSSLAQDGNPLNQPGYVIVSPCAQYRLTQRARVMLNIFNGGRGQDGADSR